LDLNGVSFSEADFFLRQSESDRKWLQPVLLALLIHFITFALSATLPAILNHRPLLDDVVTVNLVSLPDVMEEPSQEAPPKASAPKEPAQIKKIEPAQSKVPVAIQPESVAESVTPVKPVSLKPLKRKVRKTDPAKLAAERAKRQRELERQKALARAREAEAQADLEAKRARAALAEMIRQQGVQSASPAARRSTGGQEVQSIVLKQYLSLLYDRLQQYWVLPEMRQWSASLETVVVLTILPDGTVARKIIEKKSKDPFFDQFVMKTIQSATPLPRFPKLLTQSSLEVGFRFRPGELVSM